MNERIMNFPTRTMCFRIRDGKKLNFWILRKISAVFEKLSPGAGKGNFGKNN